jgi:hypothetical protein
MIRSARRDPPAGAFAHPIHRPATGSDIDVPTARAALEALIPRLDASVDGRTGEAATAIALGQQAVELYRASVEIADSHANAAQLVDRGLVEVAILARWIEVAPERRMRLWLAEDDRNRMTSAAAYEIYLGRRSRPLVDVFDPAAEETMKANIREARMEGRREKDHVPQEGAVLPSIEIMSRAAEESWEAYRIAYRVLSPWTHAGGRSLVADEIEHRSDGRHIRPGTAYGPEQTIGLAIGALLLVIETVSRQAALGLEAEAAAIRNEFATWEPASAE